MRRRRAKAPSPPLVVPRGRAWLLSFALVIGSIGCGGSGDRPLDQVDPEAVAANPTYEQVYAILNHRCVVCHDGEGGESAASFGEGTRAISGGVDPDFRDCFAIVGLRDDILERVEENTMPPGALPRLTSEQKLLIRRWVENGAPAPCN